ncbi:MAG: acetyl-CoA carboxylase biotin carboxylase subunit [Gemmatimonadetes bacterium]|nr:acetyl-CoA carboxylase biotin carboxylase subunit [Gemmatimonadota bacterium]
MIQSVLVANRGEIALRIIRTARDMGIRTVAVYSEADRTAPHVAAADEAYPIGGAAAAESYLRGDALIEVAAHSGAEAIHPGYGFLAERADFAAAVESAGLVFVGPRSETIAAMGDKTEARRRMEAAGVPIVPGTKEALPSAEEARAAADRIGYPVVLKASAGGGGKGMRVVHGADAVESSFGAAGREALNAFGDGSVYVERYLERPRHVEVQLLGDMHGTVVHLGERECSIQRRHQKLVEEAPSPVLTADQRAEMGASAVRAAEVVDYVGAGTVEFLYEDGAFFFLEMNTRLQVEHPVTEHVTGLDLVEWQFRIASGEPIPWTQADIALEGHSIECRITSESPFEGFLPSTGTISEVTIPGGPGVRWDGGVSRGNTVGLFYDPLLGKLITWAPDRTQAAARMARALEELHLGGVRTSIPLLRRIMVEDDFLSGALSIRYLEEHPELLEPKAEDGVALAAAAALLEAESRTRTIPPRRAQAGRDLSTWQRGLGR